jgi:iron complex transport system substrate-binding protein
MDFGWVFPRMVLSVLAISILLSTAGPGHGRCLISPIRPDAVPAAEILSADGNLEEFPFSFKDSSGRTILLEHPARRIVSLNRQTSEAIAVLGASDMVVATGDNTVRRNPYLGFDTLPDVGNSDTVNVEEVIALDPDVVFCPSRRSIHLGWALENAGIKVIRIDNFLPATEDQELLLLGRILQRERESLSFLSWKSSVRRLYSERMMDFPDSRKKRVAAASLGFLLSNQAFRVFPAYRDDGSVGSGEGYATILAGALDAFPEVTLGMNAGNTTVSINDEYFIQSNPDVVTLHGSFLGGYNASGDEEISEALRRVRENKSIAVTNAGTEGRVIFFHTDMLGASKREIGILLLSSMLYPELFRGIMPERFLNDYFSIWLGKPFRGVWYKQDSRTK